MDNVLFYLTHIEKDLEKILSVIEKPVTEIEREGLSWDLMVIINNVTILKGIIKNKYNITRAKVEEKAEHENN